MVCLVSGCSDSDSVSDALHICVACSYFCAAHTAVFVFAVTIRWKQEASEPFSAQGPVSLMSHVRRAVQTKGLAEPLIFGLELLEPWEYFMLSLCWLFMHAEFEGYFNFRVPVHSLPWAPSPLAEYDYCSVSLPLPLGDRRSSLCLKWPRAGSSSMSASGGRELRRSSSSRWRASHWVTERSREPRQAGNPRPVTCGALGFSISSICERIRGWRNMWHTGQGRVHVRNA